MQSATSYIQKGSVVSFCNAIFKGRICVGGCILIPASRQWSFISLLMYSPPPYRSQCLGIFSRQLLDISDVILECLHLLVFVSSKHQCGVTWVVINVSAHISMTICAAVIHFAQVRMNEFKYLLGLALLAETAFLTMLPFLLASDLSNGTDVTYVRRIFGVSNRFLLKSFLDSLHVCMC